MSTAARGHSQPEPATTRGREQPRAQLAARQEEAGLPEGVLPPASAWAGSLTPGGLLQLQRAAGNQAVVALLARARGPAASSAAAAEGPARREAAVPVAPPAARQRAPAGPAVQRYIELDPRYAPADPDAFYEHAEVGNRALAQDPPHPQWPHDPVLRELWYGARDYRSFADGVRAYQIEVMGLRPEAADGILDFDTSEMMNTEGRSEPAPTGGREGEGQAGAGAAPTSTVVVWPGQAHPTEDPYFYENASIENQLRSRDPPIPGWPYDPTLRRLWAQADYDRFADAVRNFQIETMRLPPEQADGILDDAASLELSALVLPPERPRQPAAPPPGQTALGERGPMALARAAPWRYHEAAYNRFAGNLGIPGLPATWDEFIGQMSETRFLGWRVAGHPVFLTKLNEAEARLRQQHPELANEQLLPGTGAGGRGSPVGTPEGLRTQWRADESTLSYHVFGMAVDINAGQNPWITSGSNPRAEWTIWRAAWLMGGGARAVWSAESSRWSAELPRSSEGASRTLFQRFQQSTQAVADYFRLLDDPEELARKVAALGAPPTGPEHAYQPTPPSVETLAAKDEAAWRTVIGSDRDRWPEAQRATGFMNLNEELVVALREVGLSWGASDMGPRESGDFMHFDLRSPEFERLRNAIREPMEADRAPYEERLATELPPYVDRDIEALGVPDNRQDRFRRAMGDFFETRLERYFGRWTDEQRTDFMGTLQGLWESSPERARFSR